MKTIKLAGLLIILLGVFSIFTMARAADPADTGQTTLNVPIGELRETSAGNNYTAAENGPTQYIQALYKYGIGFGALAAMFFIVFGGIKFTMSAGFPAQREDAMGMIKSAIFGLVLLISAVVILTLVNPRLSNLEPPNADAIIAKQLGFKTVEEYRAYQKDQIAKAQAEAKAAEAAAQAAETAKQQQASTLNELKQQADAAYTDPNLQYSTYTKEKLVNILNNIRYLEGYGYNTGWVGQGDNLSLVLSDMSNLVRPGQASQAVLQERAAVLKWFVYGAWERYGYSTDTYGQKSFSIVLEGAKVPKFLWPEALNK